MVVDSQQTMNTCQRDNMLVSSEDSTFFAMSAQSFTHDQLAEIYNLSRVDYIVPMPMNGNRMAEYVRQYDIDLGASTVLMSEDDFPFGIIMLGFREDRSWITRLGIIPDRRRHKVGQFLMEMSIEKSRQRHVRCVQLEVIKGNLPAFHLFKKLGFEEVGELMVIRRPPGIVRDDLIPVEGIVKPLDTATFSDYLAKRDTNVAWTEETKSLLHIESIKGFQISLPSGEVGWLIYQVLPFQLTHIVFNSGVSEEMGQALLYSLHKQYPFHDTKIENISSSDSALLAFQNLGYLEVFRRIEMHLSI